MQQWPQSHKTLLDLSDMQTLSEALLAQINIDDCIYTQKKKTIFVKASALLACLNVCI